MKGALDYRLARGILFEEAAKAAAGYVDRSWVKQVEALSEVAAGSSQTHIAFLATAILAKCVDPKIDVFSVKKRDGANTYSARGLCHGVIVPNAPELDIHLGVTGREPLNNQPYGGIDRLTPKATVRSTAQIVLNMLCDILDRLQGCSEEQARQALRAFIEVRRRHGTRYSRAVSDRVQISVEALIEAIEAMVGASSDGGRRAQAVVAALMDIFASPGRVDARRVNDPSRTIPADVNVRRIEGDGWERVFEVRDKAVTREDLYLLANKCIGANVGEATMVAIAPSPSMSLLGDAQAWATERGVTLTVFSDWASLVSQVLHWGPLPTIEAAAELPARVERRLIDLEVSAEALNLWVLLIGRHSEPPGSA